MGKKLNRKQANELFDDVLDKNVKRFGNFVINGYSVTIYRKTKDTTTQRTRAMHDDRKERGLCVDCLKPLRKIVRCTACLKRVRERRSKWIKKMMGWAK